MTDEKRVEEKTEERQQEVKPVSVEQILGNYPIDREKCRDVMILDISRALLKISNTLEGISQGLVALNSYMAENNRLKKEGK
jgi:hypothetical protein